MVAIPRVRCASRVKKSVISYPVKDLSLMQQGGRGAGGAGGQGSRGSRGAGGQGRGVLSFCTDAANNN
ncbi:hypothetical protein JYQ62_11980 [Nostoc sp. UHCC 0702]|nr:hypothetical protein JYQ62_11980 [Nostoc sp. UHCC 0702]